MSVLDILATFLTDAGFSVGRRTMNAEAWLAAARSCDAALDNLNLDLAISPTAAEQADVVLKHAAGLDSAALLLRQGESLARHGRMPRRNIEALRRARRQALAPVQEQLTARLPASIEQRIRALPLNVSALAYGGLSLFGLVWLGGFYARLGIEVIPLLRDINDILLIGLTSGLTPAVAFAALVVLGFMSLIRTRDIAVRDTARAVEIAAALRHLNHFRSADYWVPRVCLALILTVNTAAILGSNEQFHKQYDLVTTHSIGEVPNLSLLGAVGGFTVFRVKDGPLTIIPADDILCLQKVEGPPGSLQEVAGGTVAPMAINGDQRQPPAESAQLVAQNRRSSVDDQLSWQSPELTAFFASGSADVLNQNEVLSQVEAIQRMVVRQKFDLDRCWLEIRGYTDRVGSPQKNFLLSGRRADALAALLAPWRDVEALAAGVGESGPAQATPDEVSEGLNRRAAARLSCPWPGRGPVDGPPGPIGPIEDPPPSGVPKSTYPCRLLRANSRQ